MSHCQHSRRQFLKTGLAATTVAVAATLPLNAALPTAPQTATDWVTLGKSNVKVTRLAFGTGSYQRQESSASSARNNSPSSSATPTTAASASSKPPNPTATCTACSASPSREFRATPIG